MKILLVSDQCEIYTFEPCRVLSEDICRKEYAAGCECSDRTGGIYDQSEQR